MLNQAINNFLQDEIFMKALYGQTSGIPCPRVRIHPRDSDYVQISSGDYHNAEEIQKFLCKKGLHGVRIMSGGRQVTVKRANFIEMLRKETVFYQPRFTNEELAGLTRPITSVYTAGGAVGSSNVYPNTQAGQAKSSNNEASCVNGFEDIYIVRRHLHRIGRAAIATLAQQSNNEQNTKVRDENLLTYLCVKAIDAMIINKYCLNFRGVRLGQALRDHQDTYFLLSTTGFNADDFSSNDAVIAVYSNHSMLQDTRSVIHAYLEQQVVTTTSSSSHSLIYQPSFLSALQQHLLTEPLLSILKELPDNYFTTETLEHMPQLKSTQLTASSLPTSSQTATDDVAQTETPSQYAPTP